MWDTSGAEMYRALSKIYCRGANMVLICFDLTNGESFNGVEDWAEDLDQINPDVPVSLVGTKADLKRVVSTEQGHRQAALINAHYYETSSKSDLNVSEMVSEIVQILQIKEEEGRRGLSPDERISRD